MTLRPCKPAGRISEVLGAVSFSSSLIVVASAFAFLMLFPDRQPAASTKQTATAQRASLRPVLSGGGPPGGHAMPATPEISQLDPAEPLSAQEVPSTDSAPMPGGHEEENVASHLVPDEAPSPDPKMDEVNQYLWGVYQRTATKRDIGGDFTWKDVAAAAHLGMTLGDYVIVGMDPDFRKLLTIIVTELATGYKARVGDSLHGGSLTTGGYGHGCAVDVSDADGKSVPLWKWVDANTGQINLERPLPGIDPAHVQARGPWHEIAAALRRDRLSKEMPSEDVPADTELADLSSVAPSEDDLKCIGLHHHHAEPQLASATSEPTTLEAARAHTVEKLSAKVEVKPAKVEAKLPAREEVKLPAKAELKLPSKLEVKLPAKAEVKLPAKEEARLPARVEKPHPRAGTRIAARSPAANASEEKLQSHGKASARSMPRHALHNLSRASRET